MPNFEQLMRRREGVETKVYLSVLKKPTVGIGHPVTKADNLKVGDEITDKQVSDFFKLDGAKALSAAKMQAAKAGIKDKEFVVYLASVNFQLGLKWFKKLKKIWALILDGQYQAAAEALQGTRWQKQSPIRVKDFQKALRNLPDRK